MLLRQIAEAVAAIKAQVGAARLGVVMGSSTSGIERGERAIHTQQTTSKMPPDFHYEQQEMGSVGLLMAAMSGARGPVLTVSTACSSSSKAFGTARKLLALQLCDAVIVGGADSLCNLTLNGFASLEALSTRPCNPMSRHRDGITIGEGAACFLLTRASGGVQLLGVGESSDAYHLSAPDPQGGGAALAMAAALADAGLAPTAIDYINLHGTATPHNDVMESLAIARLLGTAVPCSSTKALHGHTLGAAGALELAMCWLMLDDSPGPRLAPPHVWDGQRDPALPELHLVAVGERLAQRDGWTRCLSNSFAFGGSNCALIVGRQAGAA